METGDSHAIFSFSEFSGFPSIVVSFVSFAGLNDFNGNFISFTK